MSPVVRRTEDAVRHYIDGFEAGARAALDYIAREWPSLAEPSDDYPSVTQTTAEQMARAVSLIRSTLTGCGS